MHIQQDTGKAVKKRFSVSRLLSKDKESFSAAASNSAGARRGSRAGAQSSLLAGRSDAPYYGEGE